MGYQYRGKIHDLDEPATAPVAPGEFDPAKCGTYAGYKQHQKRGVPSCDACRAACAEYRRNWYHAKKKPVQERAEGVYDPEFCGTRNGYERHRRRNTIPCAPCRAGHNDYARDYKARRAA